MARVKRNKLTILNQLQSGTLTPLEAYHQYIRTEEWKKIHDSVLLRDNYSCLCCGRTQEEIDEYNTKKGKRLLSLVVHHRLYDNLFSETETNYKDLITVCSACHRAIHSSPSNRQRFRFNL